MDGPAIRNELTAIITQLDEAVKSQVDPRPVVTELAKTVEEDVTEIVRNINATADLWLWVSICACTATKLRITLETIDIFSCQDSQRISRKLVQTGMLVRGKFSSRSRYKKVNNVGDLGKRRMCAEY